MLVNSIVDIRVRIDATRKFCYVLRNAHAHRMSRFEHDQVNCMMQCSKKLACGHRCMGKLMSKSPSRLHKALIFP